MHKRTMTRVYVFQFLYHLQYKEFLEDKNRFLDRHLRAIHLPNSLNEFDCALRDHSTWIEKLGPDSEIEVGKIDKKFAFNMIEGVLDTYLGLEKIISKYTEKRTLDKLNKVDLTILLMAAYELLYFKKTPVGVVIDEAIGIAKKFSEKSAYVFINGVLDNLAKTEAIKDKEPTEENSNDC